MKVPKPEVCLIAYEVRQTFFSVGGHITKVYGGAKKAEESPDRKNRATLFPGQFACFMTHAKTKALHVYAFGLESLESTKLICRTVP